MSKRAVSKQSKQADSQLAKAREANKNLFRPGYYQDEEGHRRMMSALGVDQVSPSGEVRIDDERKWPLSKTFALVVTVNLLAWAGIIALINAIV